MHEHAQAAVPELAKMFEVEDINKYIIPMVKDLASTTDEVLHILLALPLSLSIFPFNFRVLFHLRASILIFPSFCSDRKSGACRRRSY